MTKHERFKATILIMLGHAESQVFGYSDDAVLEVIAIHAEAAKRWVKLKELLE